MSRLDKVLELIDSMGPDSEDAAFYRLDDLLESIREEEDSRRILRPLFALIERCPERDFGAPGMIVHTLESFRGKGFEEELRASLERRATELGVWMLHRLINDSDGPTRSELLNLLSHLANSPSTSESVRQLASDFMTEYD